MGQKAGWSERAEVVAGESEGAASSGDCWVQPCTTLHKTSWVLKPNSSSRSSVKLCLTS